MLGCDLAGLVAPMLGEDLAEDAVDERGVDGDRRLALLDVETGRVATAKHPRLWRALRTCAATSGSNGVRIALPDGRTVSADDPGAAADLSALLGRQVRVATERPAGAIVERPAPEDVLEYGVEADVPYETLEIAQGAPHAAFVDCFVTGGSPPRSASALIHQTGGGRPST